MLHVKLNDIESLKRNINISTIIIFLIIFISSLFFLIFFHNQFLKKRDIFRKQEVKVAQDLYKSNLSEKLSIISSSTVFLDYLHSGSESRKNLYYQFFTQLSSLKETSITGMQIEDESGNLIYEHGKKTSDSVSLKLCYLNQFLNNQLGDCHFTWKLFFDKLNLISDIQFFNPKITTCENCVNSNFSAGNYFGSFQIKSSTGLNLPIEIYEEKDKFFYGYLILMFLSFSVFGVWNWYRLNGLLNYYIADPIKKLTNDLKNNLAIDQKSNIEEIQYLINEISHWKLKLTKIQSAEHAEKMAEVAAQVAHDIRSPISSIQMTVKSLSMIPEEYKWIIFNAVKRIYDIANNFLHQYKSESHLKTLNRISNEYIPSILEMIVSEKRIQYYDRDIKIDLIIEDNGWDIFSMIDHSHFNRVLSNLINNSVESITESGSIIVRLLKDQNYCLIQVRDSGCGISDEILNKINQGQISTNKENGSGLGLSHAFKKVSEWNGEIRLDSEENIGTTISLQIPISDKYPVWFKSNLSLPKNAVLCILDDELQVHQLWKNRFDLVGIGCSLLKFFFTAEDMMNYINKIENVEIFCFIDYELGSDLSNGLAIIEKHNLIKNSTLVTNRYDDSKVQNKCVELGIKIIPKIFIPYLPIVINEVNT